MSFLFENQVGIEWLDAYSAVISTKGILFIMNYLKVEYLEYIPYFYFWYSKSTKASPSSI